MKKAHLILAGLLLSFTLNAANDIPRPEYPCLLYTSDAADEL